ncbi:MAG: EAL domain-containing protein, partial [Spirochaetales bacterium]|nr:EAL domain-containing protein [Spirochaetales bacterium]
ADFCYRRIPNELDIFDTDTFLANPMEFHIVCTDVDSGKPVYYKYEIPVNLLEFELTESAMFEKMVFLADFGQKLRKSGFSISIDDFGSGYSSLNMLKDVEVDVLKLDKAFFENENQERGNQVISKFIELSKSLHMKVVSEGVETQEQVDFLTEVGCDMVQGYYFARPMPADEFEEKYLKN